MSRFESWRRERDSATEPDADFQRAIGEMMSSRRPTAESAVTEDTILTACLLTRIGGQPEQVGPWLVWLGPGANSYEYCAEHLERDESPIRSASAHMLAQAVLDREHAVSRRSA